MTRRLPGALAALLTAAAACSHGATSSSVLPSSDLQSNGSFDPNEIVKSASMKDAAAMDEAAVLKFLQQTPYGAQSFLATYTAHGTSAASAIATAAQRYGLNPLIFLVRAEMDQGLVAATSYPSPPSRAEFAFGCGCPTLGGDGCDPAYTGFDVQVDCLGAALRESLDAVAAHGKTDGGWAPGTAGTTLDEVQVKPKDDSTAALYQYTPVVAVGQPGGNWLFWNVWLAYAGAIGYSGPGPSTTSWIGDGCTMSGTCVYGGTAGTCATQFPGGLCTLSCMGTCPTASGKAQTFCADFGTQGGFCLATCDPTAPQCRSGYTCTNVKEFGDTTVSQNVCFP